MRILNQSVIWLLRYDLFWAHQFTHTLRLYKYRTMYLFRSCSTNFFIEVSKITGFTTCQTCCWNRLRCSWYLVERAYSPRYAYASSFTEINIGIITRMDCASLPRISRTLRRFVSEQNAHTHANYSIWLFRCILSDIFDTNHRRMFYFSFF